MDNANNIQASTARRFAVFLMILGLLFAADYYLKLAVMPRLWPLLISIFSIGLIGIFNRTRPRGGLYLAFGAYLFCFSILALIFNFTSWSMIGRAWPLFVAFLGIVLLIRYIFNGRHHLQLLLGLLIISLSIVFFLVFSLGSQYWWSALVLGGLSILVSEKTK
jgi:hypothetical protein